jgi:hypothetical protein
MSGFDDKLDVSVFNPLGESEAAAAAFTATELGIAR